MDLTSGDFNSDGITDIAIVGQHEKLVVLLGNGSNGKSDGTFGPPQEFDAGMPGRRTELPLLQLVDFSFTRLKTGDFNSDGITDIALGAADGVRIMLGNAATGP